MNGFVVNDVKYGQYNTQQPTTLGSMIYRMGNLVATLVLNKAPI